MKLQISESQPIIRNIIKFSTKTQRTMKFVKGKQKWMQKVMRNIRVSPIRIVSVQSTKVMWKILKSNVT